MADMSQADESQTDYVALMEEVPTAVGISSKKKTLAAVAQYRIGVPVLHDAPDVAMNDSDRSVPIRTRLADVD